MKKLLLFTLLTLLLSPALHAQCPSLFFDGFESGNWQPTWSAAGGTYTRSVVTTSPANGTYCFSSVGTSSHYQGTTTNFTPSTPDDLGFWVKTTDLSSNSAYVVIGDANTNSNQGIIFFYMRSNGQGRVYSSSANQYNFNVTANTWYHIEMRNINWTAKTYDIYVDGVLGQANFPFRSQSSTNIDRVFLYNFSGSATAYYDDIDIGGVNLLQAPTATDVLCDGDSTGTATTLVTNGGTAPYTYAWSSGSTNQTATNLLPGTYAVTVTDSLGCTGIDSATVGSPAALISQAAATDALCNGDSTGAIDLTPSGGVAPYTYLWSNSSMIEDPSNLPAGTYTVIVTDSNGCTSTDTASINEPTALVLNAVVTNVSCAGAMDGGIDLTPSGGTPGYNYTWNTAASTQDINGLAGGQYTVFVADSNGCSDGAIYIVNEPAVIALTNQASNVSCFGANDGMIDLTVAGGTPGYSYTWSNSTTNEDPSGLGPGVYTVVVTDSSGCTSSDTVNISEPTQIIVGGVASPNNGFNDGSVDITVSGGSPGYTFSWTGPNNFTASTEDISNLAGGTYIVTTTDLNGCTSMDTFVVDNLIGVDPSLGGPEIAVSPNPTTGLINVVVTLEELAEVRFAVTDLRGRVIYRELQPAAGLQIQREVDLNALSAGVYLLQVESGGQRSFTRVVKQ